jgi:hypothetical protein
MQHKQLIGLVGGAGVGKDTVRRVLEENFDFEGLAFADPLRSMLCQLLDTVHEHRAHLADRDLKEQTIDALGVSARELMQTLGDWGRARHPDWWVNILAQRVRHLHQAGVYRVVVSDVRFANEAEWIRGQGGEIWMIERPGLQPVRQHVSECVQFRIDQVLRNDGTLADLARRALDALASAKRFARAGREAA